jgi:SAM-dependent methyltransferase
MSRVGAMTDWVRERMPSSVHQLARAVFPARRRTAFRRQIQKSLLGSDLEQRIDALETRMHESRDETWERSRIRWRATKPDSSLTWGVDVDGEAFVSKAAQHGALGPTRKLLEVGPGYGRLLTACFKRGNSFRSYLGVDLSQDNVAYLDRRFPQENVAFVAGDIEAVELPEPVDAVISSLTFKHLFPSFERALDNLARQLSPGGRVVVDLIEGHRRYFEDDGVTYIRWYSRDEVSSILAATGLELMAFDEVRHLPHVSRLLVVARKPP